MSEKLPFAIGLAKRGGENGVPYNRDYPRTPADEVAADKSDAWEATNQLSLPPVVTGIGVVALKGENGPVDVSVVPTAVEGAL